MIKRDITLDLEDLLSLDIATESKKVILKYCLGDDMKNLIYQHAGRIALNGKDLDQHGLAPRSIKILRQLIEVI